MNEFTVRAVGAETSSLPRRRSGAWQFVAAVVVAVVAAAGIWWLWSAHQVNQQQYLNEIGMTQGTVVSPPRGLYSKQAEVRYSVGPDTWTNWVQVPKWTQVGATVPVTYSLKTELPATPPQFHNNGALFAGVGLASFLAFGAVAALVAAGFTARIGDDSEPDEDIAARRSGSGLAV